MQTWRTKCQHHRQCSEGNSHPIRSDSEDRRRPLTAQGIGTTSCWLEDSVLCVCAVRIVPKPSRYCVLNCTRSSATKQSWHRGERERSKLDLGKDTRE